MDLDSEDEANGQRIDDDDVVHNLSDDSIEEIEEDEQVLTMNNERFTVPEILFNPSDIGMDQAGISEAIVDAISSCDEGTDQQHQGFDLTLVDCKLTWRMFLSY